ncbi:FG-GAP repeat domain-containing protein [Streptomyces sp. 1222.5]|uniref:FG-GAP repeat domain-containing protein n=1 Tax=Streptomyces sp. 1222.5 TaxID=1881026 RepID=UPI003EBD1A57
MSEDHAAAGHVCGDFNSDGRMDVALLGLEGATTLPVAFSRGDGTFKVTNTGAGEFPWWSLGEGVRHLVGDFNGDRKMDIALSGGKGWSSTAVAFSNGDGTFKVTNTSTGEFPVWAAGAGVRHLVGDFNGDGKADIALSGGKGWSSTAVAFSNGDGTFKVTNTSTGEFPGWAAGEGVRNLVGDFNGDGKADIALSGGKGWSSTAVAFSNGDGTFKVTNTSTGDFPSWAAQGPVRNLMADFNGDGKMDIALSGGEGWSSTAVAFSKGDGTFKVTNAGNGAFPVWAAGAGVKHLIGDFNGDRKADIALSGGKDWSSTAVAFSNGDGTFKVTNTSTGEFPGWAAGEGARNLVGDFNGDGRADIVLSGGKGWHSTPVALSNGDGTFKISNSDTGTFASLATDAGMRFSITGDDQVAKFVEAVGTPNATVKISASVNLNLSGMQFIRIAPGVSVIGERKPSFPYGPRLFTTATPPRLFEIGDPFGNKPSDHVTISGIRLDGGLGTRQAESEEPDTDAIDIYSSQSVTIENSEIYGWRGAGISIHDDLQRLDADHPGQLPHIVGNYIHHNQHQTADVFGGGHGGGYGVTVGEGSQALVEKNTFNYNRHSIEGDGSPGTGYLFRSNLVLTGGGWNTDILHTHQIDMHGSRKDCGFGQPQWYCGPAGDYMDVSDNAIFYNAGTAVNLRGTPARSMDVHHNVFAHSNKWTDLWAFDGAFTQSEKGLTEWDNTFGTGLKVTAGKTVADNPEVIRKSACDFNGDGTKDNFIATGVNWWYSPDGNGYKYLRAIAKKITSSTSFGDRNGDGRCDVTTGGAIYTTPAE